MSLATKSFVIPVSIDKESITANAVKKEREAFKNDMTITMVDSKDVVAGTNSAPQMLVGRLSNTSISRKKQQQNL